MVDFYALAQEYPVSFSELQYICRVLFGRDRPLSAEDLNRLTRILGQYRKEIPLAYILGQEEFFGLDFFIDESVLVPRPETELLVESALRIICDSPRAACSVLDLGSGSGNVGISILKNIRPRLAARLAEASPRRAKPRAGSGKIRMVFSDISSRTFPVLKKNLTRHRITGALILRSDILSAFGKEVFDLIVANPPYVEDYFLKNNSALTYEPRAALAGGPDGLDICRKILGSARQCLKPGGRLLMEIGSGSTVKLEEYAIKYWDYAEYTIMKDYAGHPRIISLKKEHG